MNKNCRVLAALLVIVLISCKERPKERQNTYGNSSSIKDFPIVFDGEALRGWEVTNFGPQGPVNISDDEVILGMGDGCTGITWKGSFPTLNYEVSLDAKRISGNDFFCGMTFPAGKSSCTLIVGGWGGTTVGLSSIDGLDASDNSTKKLMQFEKNRWYSIRLRVTDKKITAWIDNLSVIEFQIGSHKLSVRPEVELSRPFGITSWNTTAALRNIKVTGIGK